MRACKRWLCVPPPWPRVHLSLPPRTDPSLCPPLCFAAAESSSWSSTAKTAVKGREEREVWSGFRKRERHRRRGGGGGGSSSSSVVQKRANQRDRETERQRERGRERGGKGKAGSSPACLGVMKRRSSAPLLRARSREPRCTVRAHAASAAASKGVCVCARFFCHLPGGQKSAAMLL